ncbi:hypothetical protein V6N12_059958 [Hibiscus sabdariffa]|uniref:Uncharacterized protein n=1 Tax=Hibiscus sabdariffa TaxID=183260 RepID=A0ABR2D322_9ROSI
MTLHVNPIRCDKGYKAQSVIEQFLFGGRIFGVLPNQPLSISQSLSEVTEGNLLHIRRRIFNPVTRELKSLGVALNMDRLESQLNRKVYSSFASFASAINALLTIEWGRIQATVIKPGGDQDEGGGIGGRLMIATECSSAI